MKTRKGLPVNYLKDIVTDLRQLAGSDEGRLFMLDLFEEIPHEARSQVIEGLSAFREEAVIEFIELLKLEYGHECEQTCNRVLEKLQLAGMTKSVLQPFQGNFYRAYASCSRHTGRITLDVAWKTDRKSLHVECFYLTFNSDGIHSFFLVENMLRAQYERDRRSWADMAEISFKESCFLISQAYQHNLKHMSRPALGRFLYQKYLQAPHQLSLEQERDLLRQLSAKLSPRQLVNSIFHAFKYQDWSYIQSLVSPDGSETGNDFDLDAVTNSAAIFIEGGVRKVQGNVDRTQVGAYSIVIEDGEFYYREYLVRLTREDDTWLLGSFRETHRSCCSTRYNPFCDPAYCRVYEIIDLEKLFSRLDDLEGVREVKEMPYGMHMRLTCQEEDFDSGVSFMTGVVADLIVNGDEFVVICRERNNLCDLHDFLEDGQCSCVLRIEDYDVNVLTAFRYLSGQYLSFQDVLIEQGNETICEDGMCLITARYFIKDRGRVVERLQNLGKGYCFQDSECQIYYQVEPSIHGPAFAAEYILGSNWVMLSAFGDSDMTRVRHDFEADMFGCLEFDGMEIREDGIFDVVSADLRKNCPELPAILKELYLNKWVHSRLSLLQGMSPFEARQTEEGNRLLWALYKKIGRKVGSRSLRDKPNNIILQEYIRKIEQK